MTLALWLCLASASASVSRVKRIVRHGEAGAKGGGVLRQGKKAGENFIFGKNLQKLIQQQVRYLLGEEIQQ